MTNPDGEPDHPAGEAGGWEVHVSDRLSPLDVSFLYLEERTTPMHVGSVMIFRQGPGGLDHARLLRHVEARIALVPRYRQRVRFVPGRIANPVWVDDERFDVTPTEPGVYEVELHDPDLLLVRLAVR